MTNELTTGRVSIKYRGNYLGYVVYLDDSYWASVSYLKIAEDIAGRLEDEILRGVNHRVAR